MAKRRTRNPEAKRRPALTPDEKRGQELLAFDDLRLFGIPYSQQHLRRMIKDKKFPRTVRVGENRVAFVRDEIVAWVEAIKQSTAA
jgi:hypothetical protein